MSRYIDADALITQDWFVEYIGNLEEAQVKDIIQQCKWYVMKAPTIDIVRCKECRYWDNEPFDNKTVGRCLLLKDYMNMATIAEAYCYGGKRAEQTERSE